MSTADGSNTHSGGDRPPDHESIADDRFIHGLLEFMHKDTASTRKGRIDAVMDRIGSTQETPRIHRRRILTRFFPLATAAALGIVMVSVFVFAPQPAAHAMVDAAIEATRTAPELRYEIRITDPARHIDEEKTIGTLDMRSELLLVQIEMPHGHDFMMGRDGEGEWSLRLDGSVERFDPKAAAPRWINLGDSTILIGSLDGLLNQLRDDFSIERFEKDADSSGVDATTQLVATRRPGVTKPGPERVDIWIDTDTSLVERLELHSPRPGPRPPRQGTPEGDEGLADRDDRRPPPPQKRGPPPRDHPELLFGHPRFRDGHHPPPPQRITFQRVEPLGLADHQFSPPAP